MKFKNTNDTNIKEILIDANYNRVRAMKHLMDEEGCDLKFAKDYIDSILLKMGQKPN
jgi:ATP-dependent protease HslVU (ClpYQ) ATPase subunit